MGIEFVRKQIYNAASKKVMKLTKGLYPAPLKIIEVSEQITKDRLLCENLSVNIHQIYPFFLLSVCKLG